MPRMKTTERERFPFQTRQSIYVDCKGLCAHCGKRLQLRGEDFTIEHVVPINKGGTNEHGNLVVLCQECNELKSDDIISPKDYYPYLPAPKMAQVQAIFDRYIEDQDFIGYDNLFELDRFDLKGAVPVYRPNAPRPLFVPTTFRMEKLRPAAVVDYLYLYMAHLHVRDKPIIITEEHQVTSPYYTVSCQGQAIMLVSVYIHKSDVRPPSRPDAEPRNVLFMDVFINQDITLNKGKLLRLVAAIFAIEDRISRNMNRYVPGSAIEYSLRAPASDKLAENVFGVIAAQGNTREPFLIAMDNEFGPVVRHLHSLYFYGNKGDLRRAGEKLGLSADDVRYTDALMSHVDTLRAGLDDMLDQAPEREAWVPPKAPTKKEKKSRYKKKHKPRR